MPIATDYLRSIDQLGIVYNGATHEEVVNYYFTTTTPNFPVAMRFMRDAVRYPTLRRGAVRRRSARSSSARSTATSRTRIGVVSNEMNKRLFYKYPSRKNPLGSRQTVRAATTDMMRLIQGRYYVPNNSAHRRHRRRHAGGGVQAGARTCSATGRSAPKIRSRSSRSSSTRRCRRARARSSRKPVQNVVVNIGWHGPSIGKDDAATYAADVFSFILRQPNSRFQRALVDTGLADRRRPRLLHAAQRRPDQLFVQTTPDKARAAVRAVYDEIAHFNDADYYTDEELESAKALLEADDLYSREKLSEYAHTLSFWWASTGLDYFRGYLRQSARAPRAPTSAATSRPTFRASRTSASRSCPRKR